VVVLNLSCTATQDTWLAKLAQQWSHKSSSPQLVHIQAIPGAAAKARVAVPDNTALASSSSFSVFAVFDGHTGDAASAYACEHIMDFLVPLLPVCMPTGAAAAHTWYLAVATWEPDGRIFVSVREVGRLSLTLSTTTYVKSTCLSAKGGKMRTH
jgi:hypothetical protein